MKAVLLKRLFSAVQLGSDQDLIAVCKRIVEDQKSLGHVNLARDLEKCIAGTDQHKKHSASHPASSTGFTALPAGKRDSAPLVQIVDHEHLRHYMVLPEAVEHRLVRIEKEYAARTRLAKFGFHARKRILLYGPPGCGKSLGAERLAWQTGLPLHKVRFDSLISSFFGETAVNLRKVFESDNKQPFALFLDECDTIARARGERNDVGEVSRVVNMLLQLLEDYQGDGLVIAATNHYESLDHAIYRRFDEAIEIPTPGITEIARLLQTTLSAVGVEKTVNYQSFAGSLDGLSCSEVEKIAQNAAKHCIMSHRAKVRLDDLKRAADEIRRHI